MYDFFQILVISIAKYYWKSYELELLARNMYACVKVSSINSFYIQPRHVEFNDA